MCYQNGEGEREREREMRNALRTKTYCYRLRHSCTTRQLASAGHFNVTKMSLQRNQNLVEEMFKPQKDNHLNMYMYMYM